MGNILGLPHFILSAACLPKTKRKGNNMFENLASKEQAVWNHYTTDSFSSKCPLTCTRNLSQCPCSHQPFKQQYQNSNSTNWPPKISYGISWEKTPIKNNGFCTIIVLNLMPSFFDYALILWGEIRYWSLLEVNGIFYVLLEIML